MKQIFKHTLPTQNIVVRQDENATSGFTETHAGQWYPLIRLKDEIVEFANVISFNFNTGIDRFLPTLEVLIDDSLNHFRERNFVEEHDIMTIWIGNANDNEHRPIKNDYYIVDVPDSSNSSTLSFTAVLNVPQLWISKNRAFANKTSFQVLQEIAKESGLGFVSNLSNTNDSMTWIQHSSNYDFIQQIVKKSFANTNTFIQVFIDQFANLVVMDVSLSIDSNLETLLTTFPVSGEPIQPPVQLIASNAPWQNQNDQPRASILSWAPSNTYGLHAFRYVNQVQSRSINYVEQSETDRISALINPQLKQKSLFTSLTNDHVHESYNIAHACNINNKQLLQGLKMTIVLQHYIPVIYLGMSLPVEIWDIEKIEQQDSQNSNQTFDDVQDQSQPISFEGNKNDKYSGQTLLIGLAINYRRSATPNSSNPLRQQLIVYKK